MIARFALCLTLLPSFAMISLAMNGLAVARTAHPPRTPKVASPQDAPPQDPAPPTPTAGPLTPAAMCEAAIAVAETEAKLPTRVLASIALRESGRVDPDTGRARPWPWTINYQGVGRYFASKQEAIAAVQEIQASGGQSVDVGCMQVNLMHHPTAFSTLDEAFDPKRNAAYAGRFLTGLFGALGDWGMAIGGYHSRTPGLGEAYRDQVVATWQPKDPAVLAKLSFSPIPARAGPVAGLPMVYMPFARSGPIQISSNMSYRAFLPASSAYRSFRPITVAYADFSPSRKVMKVRGRPLDLRLSQSLMGSGRALVVPRGVIERTPGRPLGMKPVVIRARPNG
jgi:hypothetical protein